MSSKITGLLITFFGLFWLLLCLYSFSQKDLNLTIFYHPFLDPFYENMNLLGYFNRPLSTFIFIILSVCLLALYLVMVFNNKILILAKRLFITLILLAFASLPAQPMFSHDIYNYMFNAKMVLFYHANPHEKVALDFPDEPWLRFMHNVHTPAPYGYGWTLLSLIPFSFSAGSFNKAYLLMKGFISLLFILEVWIFYMLARDRFNSEIAVKRTLFLALNPLLLTEIFIMGHNDSAMILPLLGSLYLLTQNTTPLKSVYGWILWLISVLTKYASVILAPFIILRHKLDLFTWGGIALLLVLLTRPEQLHSWYLHWGMVLLMLSRKSWAVMLTILLTVGGLLRYAPYTWFGNWDAPVPQWRWLILILPLSMLLFKKIRRSF